MCLVWKWSVLEAVNENQSEAMVAVDGQVVEFGWKAAERLWMRKDIKRRGLPSTSLGVGVVERWIVN